MSPSTHEVCVETVGADGDGIAHANGRALRVPGGLPGERVRLTVVDRSPLVEPLTRSPERVEPACPVFDHCGGCTLQHASPTLQRDLRLAALRRALPASLRELPVEWRPAPAAWGWRTRARLAWESDGIAVRLGHRARRSHRVTDTRACPVLAPALEASLPAVAAALARIRGQGEVALALGRDGSPVASVHVARGALDARAYTVGEALRAQGFAGAVLWGESPTPLTVVGDPAPVTVGGDGSPLVLAPDGFAQANAGFNPALAGEVLARARATGRKVLELYAGAGNFTVALAPAAAAVVAVESDRGATRALRENLRARGIDNVTVRDEPAERCADVRADVVVLDPPRTGARAVCEALAARPVAKTVVYVSCDPATLGRDLAALLPRYRVTSLTAFEMFPHTAHVEVVAALGLITGRMP
jgi:23S rRNA (uracil1939-C5)-methyltransferase